MSGTLVGRRLFGSLLFGDSDYSDYSDGSSYSYSQPSVGSSSYSSGGSSDSSGGSSGYSDFSSFFSAIQSPYSTLNQGSSSAAENTDSSSIDTSVASGARAKRTEIYGKGLDNVTIMVYMCGTDLESKSAMAAKDLMEMTRATLGGNVQILVYTGGCTKWNNNVVSSQYNQLYQVADGGPQVPGQQRRYRLHDQPRHARRLHPVVRGELSRQPQRVDPLGPRRRLGQRLRL